MKEIILGIFFITGGISFIVAGFYFRSKKYLDALCTGIYDSAKLKSKKLFATATGIFSTAIGILTGISGIHKIGFTRLIMGYKRYFIFCIARNEI